MEAKTHAAVCDPLDPAYAKPGFRGMAGGTGIGTQSGWILRFNSQTCFKEQELAESDLFRGERILDLGEFVTGYCSSAVCSIR